MTKPKRWFINKEHQGIVLMNADGPLKKPNASQSLGYIATVTAATADDVENAGKRSDYEVIIVSHDHACKPFIVQSQLCTYYISS